MRKKNGQSSDSQSLRQKAEASLETSRSQVKKMSLPEIQHLVHELQVHQIELEMQNEELRRTQLDLQYARDRYADLYDFAPVGFLTLDLRGQILEANLTACHLLEVERTTLLHQKLEDFVLAADQPSLRRHLQNVAKRHIKDVSDVLRLKHNHAHFLVRLHSLSEDVGDVHAESNVRMALLDLTEQEQVKQLQQEQEAWIGGILDTAMDAIITMDEGQRIVLFNKSAEAMFRCPSSEAIGQSIDRFIPERFRTIHHRHVQQFMQSGATIRSMGRFGSIDARRSDGEEFPIEASISQFELDGKKCLTVILRDITKRRKTEEALVKEQQFIAAILDTTDALVVVLDPQWRIVRFNRVCENLTGLTLEEMRGKFFLNLSVVSGEDAQEVKSLLASYEKGGEFPKSFEHAWVGADRQLRWVAWSNTILTDKEGRIENIIATGIDITVRKQAEEALRESEERFQAFMNHSPTVAFLKNEKDQYVYVNQQWEETLGFSRTDCLGKTDQQLFPPEGARIFKEHDREALNAREVLETEETTLDATGSVRYWWVMKFPVYSKKGEVLLGGVALDITFRKKAEEALQQRELELQENQAVLQSLGGQLISAQEDERRRISRELHDDMNQRLAILAFNIQSAQKGFSESVPMYQTLQKLYDGVSTLSDDVRHLAYQLHPSILDDLGLKVALRSFVDDFSKWEGIPVAFVAGDIPIFLPQIVTSCLYRVTQECLRNVARYAQATHVDVKLIEEAGGLRLCVKDNGKGFKVEAKRISQHGLGLIGMRERVRVVQGTYELKSAPGQGTQISVWVPVSKEGSS